MEGSLRRFPAPPMPWERWGIVLAAPRDAILILRGRW